MERIVSLDTSGSVVGAAQHSGDDVASMYHALATSRGPETGYIKIYKAIAIFE